ncbi:NlpC/P60 family protein [Actinoplanes sp. NPDC049265]|uniref:C40 family peptidase n=1 Tax=Actinoplanes sp. NPDC049265 TaxID=3363902 RepID=UPI003712A74C
MALALTGTAATAAHAEPSKTEINKKIAKASDDLEDVVESYNAMKIDLTKTENDQVTLTKSLGPAKAALEVAKVEMGKIANTSYKQGDVGTMNIVLEGPGDLLDRVSVLDQMTRDRQRKIDNYTATTQNYDSRQAALKGAQTKQSAQLNELTKRKKKIETDLKKLYAMRTAANGTPTSPGSKYTGTIPQIAGSAGKAVAFAYNAIGVMYVYGADGPNGYDCSGLTSAAWRAAGKSLPHNAAAQIGATARISKGELKAGDLVFYRNGGHVGLYVGGGMIIDASHAGEPVKKRSMNIMTPTGYGRVR